MSAGKAGNKWMEIGLRHAGKTFVDLLGNRSDYGNGKPRRPGQVPMFGTLGVGVDSFRGITSSPESVEFGVKIR